MMRRRTWHKPSTNMSLFLLAIVIFVPIVLMVGYNLFTYQYGQEPRIANGVLDLSGFDAASGEALALSGEWEFFEGRWIVSEPEVDAQPDQLIAVPSGWAYERHGAQNTPSSGLASYRVHVRHVPEQTKLAVYVPSLQAAYRIFWNGELVAASGKLAKSPDQTVVQMVSKQQELQRPIAEDGELVIEIAGKYIKGLYITPILQESGVYQRIARFRNVIANAYLGIILLLMGCYFYQWFRNRTLLSSMVLVLDGMVVLRLLMQGEMFGLVWDLLPFLQYHIIYIIAQISSFFFPALFLLYARKQLEICCERRCQTTATYIAIVCSVLDLVAVLNGWLYVQFALSLAILAIYIRLLFILYHAVTAHVEYAFAISAMVMLMLSGLLAGTLEQFGVIRVGGVLSVLTNFMGVLLLQAYIVLKWMGDLRQAELENANLRLRLRNNEISLMLSQIQPHFLYNALVAIQVLCINEPEAAGEALKRFSRHLRENMRWANTHELITFAQELDHIENYVAIEKLRFRERLTLEIQIEACDFKVPPLTVQPLVENAIKHGACKNVNGGKVTLHSTESEDAYWVYVIDNGPGFDVELTRRTLEDSYGLQNIMFRLEEQIHADIDIKSMIGVGTTVTVRIPKGRQET